ncbi:MAG: hypothetical protein ACK6DP_20300 [Gemmatimonas sp.]|jgi:hypothetical protein|uniref:hypothetical protein n=1 Tax=Gemmatimonas sp. TaxID=1962908 RepID=UPI00391F8576|nr:hypothetical protein [Gemmatimonadota bacterium]
MAALRLRHFVTYHNPGTTGSDFTTVKTFGALSTKRVRDIEGDMAWMIGRKQDTSDFYLFGRFRVAAQRQDPANAASFHVSGTNGYWFKSPVLLNDLPWFADMKRKAAGSTAGFHAVNDEDVLDGLRAAHVEAMQS